MRTLEPRTIRPEIEVDQPRTNEVVSRPIPALTTFLVVVALAVLAVVVIMLTTGTPVAEIHDSWMNVS